MLAPVIFNIYAQCTIRLLAASLGSDGMIQVNYKIDKSLFDLKKLKSKTQVSRVKLLELQYANDCVFVSDSAEGLQRDLTCSAQLYRKLGLNINLKKTEFNKFNPTPLPELFTLTKDDEFIQEVTNFKHLGSCISASCTLDDHINHWNGHANGVSGRPRTGVFENHNLSMTFKIMVYHAVVISF